MFFLLILTLFFKSFSILLLSNSSYSGFNNFSKYEKISINITIKNETEEEFGNYSIFFYNSNLNLEGNCTEKYEFSNINITEFTCTFDEPGVYSILLQNDVTSKIINYKNIITIYDNSSEFNISSNLSKNKCFNLSYPITNKQLINITFNQTINKSLLNFTLYYDDDKNDNVTAIPYEIYENYAIIGVEDQIFYDAIYNLKISSQNLTEDLEYKNVLDLTNTTLDSYETPKFLNFFEPKKNITKVNINVNSGEYIRINFDSFNNNQLDNFDSLPKIIFPPSFSEYNIDGNLIGIDINDQKYINTYLFKLNTYNIPGQAILQYHYCGVEYKYYTELFFVPQSDEDKYLSISNININKKIFLFIIIFLII